MNFKLKNQFIRFNYYVFSPSRISWTNCLTDLNRDTSSCLKTTFLLSVALIILSTASCPLSGSLQAKITLAPRLAKSSAVWYPMPMAHIAICRYITYMCRNVPAFAPVIIAVFPTKHLLLLHHPVVNFM